MVNVIYKIFTPAQWASWRELGTTHGSPDDLRDGFIHFSTAAQLQGTLDKHFAAHNQLWLIEAPTSRFGTELRWEPSRSGQLFPHLYGPFQLQDMKSERAIRRGDTTWGPLPEESS